MRTLPRPGYLSLIFLALLSLLISLPAHANNFSILIDQDRNAATGCNVQLSGSAPVAGIEARLNASVNSTAPVTVKTVQQVLCDPASGTFGAASVLPADIPVGLNRGLDASDVVEFDAPLAGLGIAPDDTINLTVTSTTGQTGSVQAAVTGVTIPGGTPPLVDIPTLSEYGFLVTMMALLAVVLWRQRHRSGWVAAVALLTLPLLALALAVNHISDGLIGDWTGTAPIATSPAGDAPTPNTDVRQVFIAQENGQFFVRLDVTELERRAPTLTVSATGPERIVEGQTASLQAVVVNATGTVSYQWQQTGGTPVTLITPNAANATFVAPATSAPVTLTFAVTATDASKTATASVETVVQPDGIFVDAGKDRSVPAEATVTLHAKGQGNGPAADYTWRQVSPVTPQVTLTGANTANPRFIAPAYDALGYPVTLVFEVTFNDGLKTASDRVQVLRDWQVQPAQPGGPLTVIGPVQQQPLVVVAPPSQDVRAPASGTTQQLVAVASGGDQNYVWRWRVKGKAGPGPNLKDSDLIHADNAAVTIPLPAVSGPTTYAFTAEVRDQGGAGTVIASDSTSLFVYPASSVAPNPLSVYGPPVTINEGALAPLSAIASGGTSPYAYAWQQTGGTPVTLQDATAATAHFTAPATTGGSLQLTFAVTVTDAANATAQATVVVTVNDTTTPSLQPLALTVPPPAIALSGATINLVANATGGDHTYTWQWTQISGPTATLSGATTARLTATLPTVTARATLTFQVTVTDGTNAQQQGTVTVTVDPAPAQAPLSVYGPPVTVNEGDLAPLSAIASGGTSPYTYAWRQTGGSPTVTLQDATSATAHFTAPATTGSSLQLTFAVTVTDNAGATANATVTVTVNNTATPSLQPLALTAPPPATALSGATINLIANATGGDRAYTWQWTQASGLAATLSGATTARLTATLPTVTARATLTFEVTVTDGTNAQQQGTVTVTVDPPPAQAPLDVFAPPVAASEGPIPVTISAKGLGGTGPYTYAWTQTAGPTVTLSYPNAPDQSIATFRSPAVDKDETLTFEVTVTDSAGASFAKAMNVLIRNTFAYTPPQVLRLQPLPPVDTVAGTSVRLAVGATGGASPYTWSWRQTGGTAASISGQDTDTLTVTPVAGAPAETLTFTVTVTDSASPPVSVSEPVQVNVLATPSTQPLSIKQIPSLHADEGASATVPAVAQGGTGNYQYQWTFTGAASGSTITTLPLTDANTSTVRFTAPQVSAKTLLNFTVEVNDGVSTVTQRVSVVINDLTPPLELNLASQPLTVHGGDTVALTPGTTKGGQGPYTYQWTQQSPATPVVTLTNADTTNPSFTAPSVTQATTLVLVMTVTDALGNTVDATQSVTVQPAATPLQITLDVPDSVNANTAFTVNTTVAGGQPDPTNPALSTSRGYAVTYTASPATAITALPGPNALQGQGTSAAPTAAVAVTITVTVTDSATPPVVATATDTIQVAAAAAAAALSGSWCLICGEESTKTPCTDLDLVLGQVTKCPDDKPYCMNDVIQRGADIKEYRRCVRQGSSTDPGGTGDPTCDSLWYRATSDEPLCLPFDHNSEEDSLNCHLCCYGGKNNSPEQIYYPGSPLGDACNLDTNPPDNTLYRP